MEQEAVTPQRHSITAPTVMSTECLLSRLLCRTLSQSLCLACWRSTRVLLPWSGCGFWPLVGTTGLQVGPEAEKKKGFKKLERSDGLKSCCPHLVSQPLSFLVFSVLFGRFHHLLWEIYQVFALLLVHNTFSFLFHLIFLPPAQVLCILPFSPSLPLFVPTLEALLLFLPTLLLPLSVLICVTLPELLSSVFFSSASG